MRSTYINCTFGRKYLTENGFSDMTSISYMAYSDVYNARLMSPAGWLRKTGISCVPNACNRVWDYCTLLLNHARSVNTTIIPCSSLLPPTSNLRTKTIRFKSGPKKHTVPLAYRHRCNVYPGSSFTVSSVLYRLITAKRWTEAAIGGVIRMQ